MEKTKVLIVAGAMNVGGIENQLMHLLRQADKSRFQIDYTTTADHPFYQDEIESLNSRCIHIHGTEGRHFFRYCRELYRVMREGQYDIVHSHELFHSGMVLLTARLAGVRHRFVHAHNWMEGDDPKAKKGLKRRVYNHVMQRLIQWNATDFIACSTLAGKFLYGEKVTRQPNYHLVFNSVDTSKFIENYDRCESGEFCEDGWTNVLQVGRFTPVKNQLFTAEIARELKARGKKIRILCAGNVGGQYDDAVAAKIREYGLEEHMLLLGVRKDIDVLMRKSAAFLLPSLYEGMPLVLIEAQASGLPCVTADTYSHEVDFGLGTVSWLQLEDGVSVWTDAVERAAATGRAEKAAVVQAIEKGGFDSRVFARKICDLYEKSMNR
jgi:glycosyltransferase EpsF